MSDEKLRKEEDVEAHEFTRPGGGDDLNPPDPSKRDDDDDVEGHGFVRPGSGEGLDPPDAS